MKKQVSNMEIRFSKFVTQWFRNICLTNETQKTPTEIEVWNRLVICMTLLDFVLLWRLRTCLQLCKLSSVEQTMPLAFTSSCLRLLMKMYDNNMQFSIKLSFHSFSIQFLEWVCSFQLSFYCLKIFNYRLVFIIFNISVGLFFFIYGWYLSRGKI